MFLPGRGPPGRLVNDDNGNEVVYLLGFLYAFFSHEVFFLHVLGGTSVFFLSPSVLITVGRRFTSLTDNPRLSESPCPNYNRYSSITVGTGPSPRFPSIL